jgi:hypothetical protein
MVKYFDEKGKRVMAIAAGGYHSLALVGDDFQMVYGWGGGNYGETGTG